MSNLIAPENPRDLEILEEYKKKGKLKQPFFPLATYDMVQIGFPRPDHGEMVRRVWGGSDEDGNLMSPNGMWCKVEDVKKWVELELDKIYRFLPQNGKIYKIALEVLESDENVRTWLKTKLPIFGGKTPLEYADTLSGSKEVERVLRRMEQGIPQ